MPKKDTIEPIDTSFERLSKAMVKPTPTSKEITSNASKIKSLAGKSSDKGIADQGELFGIEVERDIGIKGRGSRGGHRIGSILGKNYIKPLINNDVWVDIETLNTVTILTG